MKKIFTRTIEKVNSLPLKEHLKKEQLESLKQFLISAEKFGKLYKYEDIYNIPIEHLNDRAVDEFIDYIKIMLGYDDLTKNNPKLKPSIEHYIFLTEIKNRITDENLLLKLENLGESIITDDLIRRFYQFNDPNSVEVNTEQWDISKNIKETNLFKEISKVRGEDIISFLKRLNEEMAKNKPTISKEQISFLEMIHTSFTRNSNNSKSELQSLDKDFIEQWNTKNLIIFAIELEKGENLQIQKIFKKFEDIRITELSKNDLEFPVDQSPSLENPSENNNTEEIDAFIENLIKMTQKIS